MLLTTLGGASAQAEGFLLYVAEHASGNLRWADGDELAELDGSWRAIEVVHCSDAGAGPRQEVAREACAEARQRREALDGICRRLTADPSTADALEVLKLSSLKLPLCENRVHDRGSSCDEIGRVKRAAAWKVSLDAAAAAAQGKSKLAVALYERSEKILAQARRDLSRSGGKCVVATVDHSKPESRTDGWVGTFNEARRLVEHGVAQGTVVSEAR